MRFTTETLRTQRKTTEGPIQAVFSPCPLRELSASVVNPFTQVEANP